MADCKHNWVYNYSSQYKKSEGRNSLGYYHSDHFHCSKCTEQKVIEKHHFCFDQELWKAPRWVQVMENGKMYQQ